ncbi:MAG: patatin-like phospholipase family protein, partial [Acidobacteriota bacterium]|nr:patatin-like phospholipase family protein [Acidobacteriota bacterium]
LAALEDAGGVAFAGCDYFVGTSAGAVVAVKLACGRSLWRPPPGAVGAATGGPSPLTERVADAALAIAAPFALLGLRLGAVPGELLRSAVLRMLPSPAQDTLDFTQAFPADRTRFDGRLRLVAVDRAAGRRVVFGAPGAPQATVAEALRASCALPLVFSPGLIGGREYVDGATWSTTNADVAPATRDMQVLIVAPMAGRHGPFSAPVRVGARAALLLEASALKARGARVRAITPDRDSSLAIGPDLMSDAGLAETHAAGYAQAVSL